MAKFNYYLGGAASSWLLALMVVAAELYEPFKTALTNVFGHHWIGKMVAVALSFVAFGFLIKGKPSDAKIGWYSVVGSLAAIFLFFLGGYFI